MLPSTDPHPKVHDLKCLPVPTYDSIDPNPEVHDLKCLPVPIYDSIDPNPKIHDLKGLPAPIYESANTNANIHVLKGPTTPIVNVNMVAGAGQDLQAAFDPLTKLMKDVLSDKIEVAHVNTQLVNHPCVLIVGEHGEKANMEGSTNAQVVRDNAMASSVPRKIMELNPSHPLVIELMEKASAGKLDHMIVDYIQLLFDIALLTSGLSLEEPAQCASRIQRLIKLSLSRDDNEVNMGGSGNDASMNDIGDATDEKFFRAETRASLQRLEAMMRHGGFTSSGGQSVSFGPWQRQRQRQRQQQSEAEDVWEVKPNLSVAEAAEKNLWVEAVVTKWFWEKGYGFLRAVNNESTQVFAHCSVWRRRQWGVLGERVVVKVAEDMSRGGSLYKATTVYGMEDWRSEVAAQKAEQAAREVAEAAKRALHAAEQNWFEVQRRPVEVPPGLEGLVQGGAVVGGEGAGKQQTAAEATAPAAAAEATAPAAAAAATPGTAAEVTTPAATAAPKPGTAATPAPTPARAPRLRTASGHSGPQEGRKGKGKGKESDKDRMVREVVEDWRKGGGKVEDEEAYVMRLKFIRNDRLIGMWESARKRAEERRKKEEEAREEDERRRMEHADMLSRKRELCTARRCRFYCYCEKGDWMDERRFKKAMALARRRLEVCATRSNPFCTIGWCTCKSEWWRKAENFEKGLAEAAAEGEREAQERAAKAAADLQQPAEVSSSSNSKTRQQTQQQPVDSGSSKTEQQMQQQPTDSSVSKTEQQTQQQPTDSSSGSTGSVSLSGGQSCVKQPSPLEAVSRKAFYIGDSDDGENVQELNAVRKISPTPGNSSSNASIRRKRCSVEGPTQPATEADWHNGMTDAAADAQQYDCADDHWQGETYQQYGYTDEAPPYENPTIGSDDFRKFDGGSVQQAGIDSEPFEHWADDSYYDGQCENDNPHGEHWHDEEPWAWDEGYTDQS